MRDRAASPTLSRRRPNFRPRPLESRRKLARTGARLARASAPPNTQPDVRLAVAQQVDDPGDEHERESTISTIASNQRPTVTIAPTRVVRSPL